MRPGHGALALRPGNHGPQAVPGHRGGRTFLGGGRHDPGRGLREQPGKDTATGREADHQRGGAAPRPRTGNGRKPGFLGRAGCALRAAPVPLYGTGLRGAGGPGAGRQVLPLAPSSGTTLARGRRHTHRQRVLFHGRPAGRHSGDPGKRRRRSRGGARAPERGRTRWTASTHAFMRAMLDEEGSGTWFSWPLSGGPAAAA